MTVTQGTSFLAPYVCALYTCKCGRRGVTHGAHSGAPPKGWETHGEQHVCEVCCGQPKRSAS